ncbi:MAG: hypothetical protein ACLFV4_09590 [Candidatus Hydrogenedentota bacterium]
MRLEKFRVLNAVIASHPEGRVYGRTRLQKTILLLQELGLPTDYRFSIYFYGPYSEGLTGDLHMLCDYGFADEEKWQNLEGNPYSVFSAELESAPEVSEAIRPFKSAIERISRGDNVALELAATYVAYYDMCDGDQEQAMVRLQRKKGAKCTEENLQQAMALLQDLGLPYAEEYAA